jgi:NADH:ubiquinone oxidoreductase subunit 2 (subunit N)
VYLGYVITFELKFSFIFLYSSLELQSLSLYLLAASSRTSIFSAEAAFSILSWVLCLQP